MSNAPKPTAALLNEVTGEHKLKHVEAPKVSQAQAEAQVMLAIDGGKAASKLKHVDAPKDGLTEAQKKAFLEKTKDEE